MTKIRAAVRNFLRYFNYHILWRLIFFISSVSPVDEKLVIFADTHSTKLTDNMKCVYDRLLNRGSYRFVFCLAPELSGKKLLDLFAVYFGFMRFCWHYARCGTLVLTDSYLPAFACKPRKGTTVIQLWHACGAFKKWGYSTADYEWGADKKALALYPLHNCYSKVCVSSECVVPFYAQAFSCDKDIICPVGVPRTDIFFDKGFVESSRQAVQDALPGINGRKIILYAPTFRGANHKSARIDFAMDSAALKDALGDRYVFINKFHPYVQGKTEISDKLCDFVFNAPSGMDVSVLLCACDILISDYSSLIFEYSLLSRPMIFYAYDLNEYDKERGFYYSYCDFVPGDIVFDTGGIIDSVKNIEQNFDKKRVREFCKKFMGACDGDSTDRIMEWIK